MRNNNNSKKIVLGCAFPMLLVGCLASCGNKYDPKTSIYIEPFSGSGFGYQYIEDIANEWKAATGSNYNIIVDRSSVYMSGHQLNQIESGISKTDIFFGAEPNYKAGIYKGFFEDLTDFLDVKPDGESGKTVREKITNFDTWEKVGAKNTYNETTGEFGFEGMYMLPFSVTVSGLVFDYDVFEEKGLISYAAVNAENNATLTAQGISYQIEGNKYVFSSADHATNYKDGDYIATAGKDGKFGTYDDGQPTTYKEYTDLVNKIIAKGGTPYIYSTEGSYLDSIAYSVFTQVAGLDSYDAVTSFDSHGREIELYDGSKEAIDWNNGYKAYSSKGIEESVKYLSDQFYANKNNYMEARFVSGAQDPFINGLINNGKFYGFINEGNWFENEAAETFKAAAKRGGRAYGDYDLRFLLTPDFDGQKGIDGTGHGTCMSAPEYGAITVRKQEDPEKLAAIKSLLAYFLKNDSLAKSNVQTGLVWGYDYTIPDDLKPQMTLFQKNTYELYHDTDNVRVLANKTDLLTSPMSYASKSFISESCIIPVGNQGSIATALKNSISSDNIMKLIRGNYTADKWANILKEVKDQLS